ncbi:hypothetical protein IPA_07310 [Ignicoccus pacificus DSM 13166]|uniref:Uncharacterized protein n=1 Tax=Ignicoccus pacificus DSM 13166 TaxID=940294 RepID=A0A977PLT7_9CREN|nr:hypothetical protein IPA_07310 [Ignicoccus pacificus DSM 13166]
MKWAAAILMLMAIAMAACNPQTIKNITIPWKDEWVTSIKVLSQVYRAKVSAEIVILKAHNDYQKILLNELKKDFKISKELADKADGYYVLGNRTLASAYYLASFAYAYRALELINFMKLKYLNSYSERLTRIGELLSSAAFSSFKLAVRGKGCSNTSRVLYVYLYSNLRTEAQRIKQVLANLPGTFNAKLANMTIPIVNKLSEALAYEMAQYYLSLSGCKKDFPLPNATAPCPKGIGPSYPWLPHACYLVQNPQGNALPRSPCARFVALLGYLLNDTQVVRLTCSMR